MQGETMTQDYMITNGYTIVKGNLPKHNNTIIQGKLITQIIKIPPGYATK